MTRFIIEILNATNSLNCDAETVEDGIQNDKGREGERKEIHVSYVPTIE